MRRTTQLLAAVSAVAASLYAVPAAGAAVPSPAAQLSAASTVSAGEVAALKHDAVGVNRTAGVFRPLLSAGDAIYGGQYRCSLGFNVVKDSTYYFLTAGHCGNVAKTWYTNSGHTTLIGPTVDYSFPGNDYALVQYSNIAQPAGWVHRGQRVRR